MIKNACLALSAPLPCYILLALLIFKRFDQPALKLSSSDLSKLFFSIFCATTSLERVCSEKDNILLIPQAKKNRAEKFLEIERPL